MFSIDVHVYDSDDGCGAGEFCRSCSALAAIVAGEIFTVFSVEDKSFEYRRQMLARFFFHDIMNVVGNIRGFSESPGISDFEDRHNLYAPFAE